ncbi:hypothetical protein BDZ97DRAFT_102784 [Flammula alnicola]|nr:hypothetical protein BDZ97DRAFT_102784 [Flammula alnicola]
MDSRAIERLLSSNEPPHPTGTVCVTDTIRTLETELRQRAILKRNLFQCLAAISSTEERLATEIAKLRATVCLMRRMPHELIVIMVGFAYDGRRPHELLDYARVSKRWREAILSAPRLWIVVTLPKKITVDVERVIEGLKNWIARSGLLRLWISFETTSVNWADALAIMAAFPEKKRWKGLKLGPRFVEAHVTAITSTAFRSQRFLSAHTDDMSCNFPLHSLSLTSKSVISISNFTAS